MSCKATLHVHGTQELAKWDEGLHAALGDEDCNAALGTRDCNAALGEFGDWKSRDLISGGE